MQDVKMTVETIANTLPGKGPGGLPSPVVGLAKYWCKISGGKAPRWSDFKMTALGESMPHVTVLHKMEDGGFAFEFCGSAVAAMFGHDLTGEIIIAVDGTQAEIDWTERVRPVLADGECHLQNGIADPKYTSPFDFVGLDMPLRNPDNDEIGYIVSCTAPRLS